MIKFKKKGRHTKPEKNLLKQINDFIEGLSPEEKSKHDFVDTTVHSKDELDSIWDRISASSKPIEEPTNSKPMSDHIEDAKEVTEETTTSTPEPTPQPSSQQGVPDFFNPLAEDINQREYNKIEKTADISDIPEPEFKGRSAEEAIAQGGGDEMEQGVEKEPSPFENVTNPAVNQLEGKEKKMAVKQLVTTVLDLYEMGHGMAANFIKISESDIVEKVASGEIDPTLEIPIDEHGTTTNPIEFMQKYNQDVETVLTYDPEFGDKVRPAMERVFEKKGWGFTDEQYLYYMFGKDLAVKGTMVFGLKKSSNMIMNTFMQMHQMNVQAHAEATVASQPIEPDHITNPQPQPGPEPVDEFTGAEAVEQEFEEQPIEP